MIFSALVLQLVICSSTMALQPSYFEDIAFSDMAKRRVLQALEDVSALNCAHRCKRDLSCYDIAFRKSQTSVNNGLCILLTKLKPTTCEKAEGDGQYIIKGDVDSTRYDVRALCKVEDVSLENVIIEEQKYFRVEDFEDSDKSSGDFVFMKKRPQLGEESCI